MTHDDRPPGQEAFIHTGPVLERAQLSKDIARYVEPMPQVRVDPLTGLKTIIAGDRARAPGRRLDGRARAADRPRERPVRGRPRGPDAAGALRAARRANGGWAVRVVPNLYPALEPDARTPEPYANPDLFTAQPAAARTR